MTEEEQRQAVCIEARTWLRTPYHHMGRIKGVGVDCATLLAEVYERAGITDHVCIDHYPMDWNLHRESERYLGYLTKYMNIIKEEDAKPGDVVMFRFGRTLAHGAIILDPGWPSCIHSSRPDGIVCYVDGRLKHNGKDRERHFYSAWNSR